MISRLVIVPKTQKRFFWAREVKFLNDLLENYPSIDFWKKIKFDKQFESLLALKGDYGKRVLKKKYLEYSYVIPSEEKLKIGKKVGKDKKFEKKVNTIKDFLSS